MKKTPVLIIMLLVLISCNHNNRQSQIAKANIEKYLKENLNEGATLTMDKFSPLYIIEPKNTSNMPKPVAGDSADFANELKLHMPALSLVLGGCSPHTLEDIITNDKKFQEWKTGGKEFVMICFFTGKDKYLNEYKGGLCFILDSVMQVYKPYRLKDEAKIYDMIE